MATETDSVEVPAEQPIYATRFGWGKIVAVVANVIVVVMILISVGLCIGYGVKFSQPKYFFLLANLLLSSAVTAVFLFWYYRGVMVQGLIWYIVLQCFFLFFQCVTTDVFALYAPTTANTNPLVPVVPSIVTMTTKMNASLGDSPLPTDTLMLPTAYQGPIPTPTP